MDFGGVAAALILVAWQFLAFTPSFLLLSKFNAQAAAAAKATFTITTTTISGGVSTTEVIAPIASPHHDPTPPSSVSSGGGGDADESDGDEYFRVCGYLSKSGIGLLAGVRRRWFVIEGKFLLYYSGPSRATLHGRISLLDIFGVRPENDVTDADGFAFRLVTEKRIYFLLAPSVVRKLPVGPCVVDA